jgi:hypothetical protein
MQKNHHRKSHAWAPLKEAKKPEVGIGIFEKIAT